MNLNTFLLIIGLGAIAFIGYKILQKLEKPKEDQAMLMLQKQLFEIEKGVKAQDKSINEQMNKSRDVLAEGLQKQFATTVKMVKDMQDGSKAVAESLTKMEATSKQVLGFAEQMKSLENILKNPKQRGILGEFFSGKSAF